MWSPTRGWATLQSRGIVHQPQLIICHSHPVLPISSSLFREVRHAFPGAPICFTASEDASHLILTAVGSSQLSFSMLHFEVRHQQWKLIGGQPTHHMGGFRQILVFSTLPEDQYAVSLLKQRYHLKNQITGKMVSAFGYNQLPGEPAAYALAFHGEGLLLNAPPIQKTGGRRSGSAQQLSTPVGLEIVEVSDSSSCAIPMAFSYLLKK